MRYLYFKGSTAKVLLPSAEAKVSAEVARSTLLAGEELTNSVVVGLDLDGQRLDKLVIRNCILENADLANVAVEELRLARVVIADSTLVGFRSSSAGAEDTLFDTCRLDLATPAGLKLSGVAAFVSCAMNEIDLRGADARSGIFYDCQMERADVTGARLGDLRGCALDGVRGLSTLQGVTLSPDQLPDLLLGLQRDLDLTVDESESEIGPVGSWREAPER